MTQAVGNLQIMMISYASREMNVYRMNKNDVERCKQDINYKQYKQFVKHFAADFSKRVRYL